MNRLRGLTLFFCFAGMACGTAALPAAERGSAPAEAYILRTMPVRHESRNAEVHAPVEALWKHLLAQLREVPGITLLPSDAAARPGDERQEYSLTLASLPTTVTRLGNGMETFSYSSLYDPGTRGTYVPALQSGGTRWPIEIRVERNGRDTTPGTMNSITFLYQEGAPRPPICQQELKPETLQSGSMCWTYAELAERIADTLRLEKLPADDGMYRKLLSRIADPSLSERQRSVALNNLSLARRRGRFVTLDQQGLAAISAFASGASSPMRGQIWNTLQGGSPTEFVPLMLQTLQSDPSDETRLQTFDTLAADHGNDPRVRAAFATAAREDGRDLIRMLATRALGGETAWRDYVVATLKNSQLSAEQRTEPLLYIQGRAQDAELRAMAGTPAFATALLSVARDNRSVTDVSVRGPIRRSLNMLLQYGDPAQLALHSDWAQLQQEFSAGPRALPAADGRGQPVQL
jgi:hypothetical protein